MVVNGFELPDAFAQLCEAIRRGEAEICVEDRRSYPRWS
jgi:hypothetical protein